MKSGTSGEFSYLYYTIIEVVILFFSKYVNSSSYIGTRYGYCIIINILGLRSATQRIHRLIV